MERELRMVPLCDLKQQYQSLQTEIDAAMQKVAASGHYVLGPEVKAFEQEMAEYHDCKYAIGVGSGTDALHLSLRALGIGPGDEVITTPFTFIATTEAIGMVGAKPVFVDIDPDTFNIDVRQMEAVLTPQTKAIIPVHLYGQPCNMGVVLELAAEQGLDVVEDCAQSVGAEYHGCRVGTLGDAGCLSFFPSKNLGCCGDGGMVLTNSKAVFESVEMLRRHGGKVKYHHSQLGLNSRLDELQAAILRVKLKYLDQWNEQRRLHAYSYNRLFAECHEIKRPAESSTLGLQIPTSPASASRSVRPVYHQYTIEVDRRDEVIVSMKEQGVQCFPYYPVALHLQEVHQDLAYSIGSFPHAEHASRHCLSLPMFPELTLAQQQQVVHALSPSVALAS